MAFLLILVKGAIMKLNLKKSRLINLSNDNKTLPQNKVLPQDVTPQIGGGFGTQNCDKWITSNNVQCKTK